MIELKGRLRELDFKSMPKLVPSAASPEPRTQLAGRLMEADVETDADSGQLSSVSTPTEETVNFVGPVSTLALSSVDDIASSADIKPASAVKPSFDGGNSHYASYSRSSPAPKLRDDNYSTAGGMSEETKDAPDGLRRKSDYAAPLKSQSSTNILPADQLVRMSDGDESLVYTESSGHNSKDTSSEMTADKLLDAALCELDTSVSPRNSSPVSLEMLNHECNSAIAGTGIAGGANSKHGVELASDESDSDGDVEVARGSEDADTKDVALTRDKTIKIFKKLKKAKQKAKKCFAEVLLLRESIDLSIFTIATLQRIQRGRGQGHDTGLVAASHSSYRMAIR